LTVSTAPLGLQERRGFSPHWVRITFQHLGEGWWGWGDTCGNMEL
jgi:hypothetical protein